jgi:hypothetical protein
LLVVARSESQEAGECSRKFEYGIHGRLVSESGKRLTPQNSPTANQIAAGHGYSYLCGHARNAAITAPLTLAIALEYAR